MGELGHPSRREDSPSTSGRSHSRHADQQQHIVPANLKKKDEQLVSNLRSRAPEGLDELNMDGVAYNLICKLKEVSAGGNGGFGRDHGGFSGRNQAVTRRLVLLCL